MSTNDWPAVRAALDLEHEDLLQDLQDLHLLHPHINENRRQRSAVAPLFTLLDELVVNIMLILRDASGERNFKWSQHCMNFCSSWRRIGLNTPTLWTKIFQDKTEPLKTSLLRSRPAPLDIEWRNVDVSLNESQYMGSIPLLALHFHRTRSLVWGADRNDDFMTLVSAVTSSAGQDSDTARESQLVSLDLTFSYSFPVHQIYTLIARAQSLDHFTLTIESSNQVTDEERTTFYPNSCQPSGVRHLVLRNICRTPEDIYLSMIPSPSIFFALKSLVLGGEFVAHKSSQGILEFPFLLHLQLESAYVSRMCDLMEGIRSPHIKLVNCHNFLGTEDDISLMTTITSSSLNFLTQNCTAPFQPHTLSIKYSHANKPEVHFSLEDKLGRLIRLRPQTDQHYTTLLCSNFFEGISCSEWRTLDLDGNYLLHVLEVLPPHTTSFTETLILNNFSVIWPHNFGPTSREGRTIFPSLQTLIISSCDGIEWGLTHRYFIGPPIPRLIRRGLQPSYATLQYWLHLGLAERIELESGEEVECWEDEPEADFTDSDLDDNSDWDEDSLNNSDETDGEASELGTHVLHPNFPLIDDNIMGSDVQGRAWQGFEG
ncbi:hypothetical protein DL96DRAFT_1559996 [Flagelloscypha sp. PMI_526]|nr:hypothetical protein DL96DRAFT_1559996 [Flagelloscypha sp. PMI_526]